jgi:hypothetical protein
MTAHLLFFAVQLYLGRSGWAGNLVSAVWRRRSADAHEDIAVAGYRLVDVLEFEHSR